MIFLRAADFHYSFSPSHLHIYFKRTHSTRNKLKGKKQTSEEEETEGKVADTPNVHIPHVHALFSIQV